MNNFIELHDLTNTPITVNINQICAYKHDGKGTRIWLSSGAELIVIEEPNRIKCSIYDNSNKMTHFI